MIQHNTGAAKQSGWLILVSCPCWTWTLFAALLITIPCLFLGNYNNINEGLSKVCTLLLLSRRVCELEQKTTSNNDLTHTERWSGQLWLTNLFGPFKVNFTVCWLYLIWCIKATRCTLWLYHYSSLHTALQSFESRAWFDIHGGGVGVRSITSCFPSLSLSVLPLISAPRSSQFKAPWFYQFKGNCQITATQTIEQWGLLARYVHQKH